MPKIRCHYIDCGFLDDGYCSAAAVEIDPDTGCATYAPVAGAATEDEWDEEEEELEEWEELEDEDEEDVWGDEEEEEY
ncbi:MAG TPA: hypothetical protein VFF78_07690 [Anaerolineaceae bacterium]|nr:hypothetical protein [Anaerolineaceae bacterium]